MKKAYGFIALLALSVTSIELVAQPTPRQRRDRRENVRDRREDVRDRSEDVRDRSEDVRDRREDRRDRRRRGNYATISHPQPRVQVNTQVGFRMGYGPQFRGPRHHGYQRHHRHYNGRHHHRHCRR